MQEDFQHHISQRFNQELETLTDQLLKMGGLVEKQVSDAVSALLKGDTELAEQVQQQENYVNRQDINLDEACTRVLALQQPAARDLRMTLAISKCVSDLERIGDEANKIARMACQLAEEGEAPKGYVQVRHIGLQVGAMLHDVLHAFVRLDAEQAVTIAARDEEVDAEYRSAMRGLVTFMMEDPRSISQVLNIIWVLRALERIGDHACNIAEQIIYMVKGHDMRHASVGDMEELLGDAD